MTRTRWAALAMAAACVPPAALAQPQAYPVKPVRLIIAQAQDTTTGAVAHIMSSRLSKTLGQPVALEARAGAGGLLGTELAAKAPADGYHLFLANNSTHGTNPAVYASLPFDPIKDFAPVVFIGTMAYVLCAHPSLPAKTPKELIAFARSRGPVRYASPGVASTPHLAGELLRSMARVDLVHVPYKGRGAALSATFAGESALLFAPVATTRAHVDDGRVTALGVSTRERTWLLPAVPTLAESGFPGFEMHSWFGLLAPAGVPPGIAGRLNAEANRVLAAVDARAMLLHHGIDPRGGPPARFADLIRVEIAKLRKIAKAAGIRANEHGDS